eukprot:3541445-Rhodomonas_salina.2
MRLSLCAESSSDACPDDDGDDDGDDDDDDAVQTAAAAWPPAMRVMCRLGHVTSHESTRVRLEP